LKELEAKKAMTKRITSATHPTVHHLVRLRTDSSYRMEQGTCLVTGRRLVHELCERAQVVRLIWSDAALRPPQTGSWDKVEVTEQLMAKIGGMTRMEGIAAEVKLPPERPVVGASRLLICDSISDPGNLGTLLRTALAFGWDGVCCIDGVDPFNDKVLRASRGALFTLPYSRCTWSDLLESWSGPATLFAADMGGTPIEEIAPPERLGLILSHESTGVNELVRQRAALVAIPMEGGVESLNVAIAGAIALYLWK
jgi:RNA methyltransferase, TrmH family